MKHRSGFTLLELSIVLVIIAMLIGGVLVGQTMVRDGELRNGIGELGMYTKAINEFQDKYFALPGDFLTATTLWGTDVACPSVSNTVPKTATCNGDGNGSIGSSSTAAVLTAPNEWFRAWQQLANANLIKGKFTGVKGPGGTNDAVIGVNVPRSDISSGGWTLLYYLRTTAGGALWPGQYGHILALGAQASGTYTNGSLLSPIEAQSIDEKLDDGKPGTGKVLAWRQSVVLDCTLPNPDTGGGVTAATTTYNTSDTYTGVLGCSLVFPLGF